MLFKFLLSYVWKKVLYAFKKIFLCSQSEQKHDWMAAKKHARFKANYTNYEKVLQTFLKYLKLISLLLFTFYIAI